MIITRNINCDYSNAYLISDLLVTTLIVLTLYHLVISQIISVIIIPIDFSNHVQNISNIIIHKYTVLR